LADKLDLRELLADRVLIGDGAVGTLLQERGIRYDHPYARANLTYPDTVRRLHEDYARAGADIIETNTFSANAVKLSTYDLEHEVRDINAAGARLARAAANGERDVLVFGALGPLGKPLAPIGDITREEARKVFREQAEALLEGGVDALVVETFTDMEELRLAFEEASGFGVPVLAYRTFVEDGETINEGLPARSAREIGSWGADLIGSNCTVGPQRMLQIVGQMSDEVGPVAAFPNPGLPQLIGGVVRYRRDVDHFAAYGKEIARAGARLVGGCCGTTPEHVAALAGALRDFEIEERQVRARPSFREIEERAVAEPASELWQKIKSGFAVAAEVDLPRGHNVTEVVEAARHLKERGIDAIDISDGARARLRMKPVAVAHIVQEQAGIEVMAHLSCRDQNLIGLQAELLGAAALGVKNILPITGDPAQIGDYPEATSVFDTDAIGLVHILSRFNRGEDLSGNSIGEPPGFLIGVAFNPTAEDLDHEVERLRRKVDAGAHAAWTQPVFEIGALERALEKIEDLDFPILVGLMPLRSARQAEFLHHEVPGIDIPRYIRERLAGLSKEDAPRYGVEVAQHVLSKAHPLVQGAYIMPPASAPELAADVVEVLERSRSG
jgi:methionine synthase I (cobalamin-dependent)/5,10-methylenetetrahydrofolate reductase